MSVSKVPLTYFYIYKSGNFFLNDFHRQAILHEFAASGAKHLVLTHELIEQIHGEERHVIQLQKEMAYEGLTFVDSHAPFGLQWDLNCPEENLRNIMIARHKLNINIAAAMGVDTMTIHVGNDYDTNIPIDLHRKRISEALEAILPEAEKCGVTVCIENIWFRINTPEELLYYKKLFPTDALGLCYDAGHANLMDKGRLHKESFAYTAAVASGLKEPLWDDNILVKMLPHVVNCHIHDNDGKMDMHMLPGTGNIDWGKIALLLKKAPRLKNIQLECLSASSTIGEQVNALKKIFGQE